MSRLISKEDFLQKAQILHGDKYNYSKVIYTKTKDKVNIVCSTNGDFFQTPANHLKGQGCPECAKLNRALSQRYSTQDFIDSVKEVHKNKYDYKLVNYVNSQTKVDIICSVHGVFTMKPNSHFNGQGCPKCGRISAKENIKLDYSEFLIRAEKTHKNLYFYDENSYVNYTSKMKIYCSEHGYFDQIPHAHISMKAGCPKCGYLKSSKSNTKSWESVLDIFQSIHGDRYNYKTETYINVTTKMSIQCLKHGWFEQNPSQHFNGHGCKFCGIEDNAERKKIHFEEFIIKSKLTHGDRYIYSENDYKDIFTPIQIECLKHGYFLQIPRDHYRGSGCPKCSSSRGENLLRLLLEEFDIQFEEQKSFDGLYLKNKLKCDFFLPKYNTVIEYNGIQHYEPIDPFGGIQGLRDTQKRDIVKYDYLTSNNIKLIIVKYDNKDVKSYLIEKLGLIL
jgi:hypothetical protein